MRNGLCLKCSRKGSDIHQWGSQKVAGSERLQLPRCLIRCRDSVMALRGSDRNKNECSLKGVGHGGHWGPSCSDSSLCSFPPSLSSPQGLLLGCCWPETCGTSFRGLEALKLSTSLFFLAVVFQVFCHSNRKRAQKINTQGRNYINSLQSLWKAEGKGTCLNSPYEVMLH